MIANGGWVDFTMPSCVAPGQYLLRAEIIALHNGNKMNQAQFYMVCSPVLASSFHEGTGTPNNGSSANEA